jgi:hypothetical protein
MALCAQKRRGALMRNKVVNIEHTVLEDCVDREIESLVARIWEEIEQQELPVMLEDLESLKYVPVEVRKKAASEPLFLVRYE